MFVRENSIPARANKAEEHRPWVIIVIYMPLQPHLVIVNIEANVNLMWATEEYAINALKSVCRIVMMVVMAAPQEVRASIGEEIGSIRFGKHVSIRKSPNLPSFNSRAANTIEPAVGASTWALGSQR